MWIWIKRFFAAVSGLVFILGVTLYWLYADVVISTPASEKIVSLTFDDGPHPQATQELLALLSEKDVYATFFLKGRNVDAYPELVAKIDALGHEIGNHSYYHKAMWSFDRAAMRAEVERTNRAISSVTGVAPKLFRPPYFAQGPGLKLALEELGMLSVGASASGQDWEITDPELIASKVLAQVEPGGIVVLHDGHADIDDPAAQDSRSASVIATGIIIDNLRQQGYQFHTAGQLISQTNEPSPVAGSQP